MSKLNDRERLKHAYDAATLIQNEVAARGLKTIIDDPLLLAGVERHLEIIGEAVNHLSDVFKEANPQVEWKKIVRFRNFLAHEYFSVDLAIVLDIVNVKLPQLVAALTPIITTDL